MLSIDLSRPNDPEAFERVLAEPPFARIAAHPHTGAFGRIYHAAVHGSHDCSFVVGANGAPALVCLCAPLDGKLGFYGMPLRLIARHGLDDDTRRAAVHSAFAHFDELVRTQRLQEVMVTENAGPILSAVGQSCLERAGTATLRLIACVDLTLGALEWRKALRRRFRTFINWGRNNLSIRFVNKENPDRVLFDQYREFHADIAGRITRPGPSWDVMYDWTVKGQGELVAGFLNEKLVTGSLFIDGGETCIYASGVNDRLLFNKPLAHYPMWLAIERAQARGVRTFELGEVPFQGTVSEKEYNIGYFKRGFATHIDAHLVWRWSPASYRSV